MCLILVAYKLHPQTKLAVLANRDEFYDRPTENAQWWDTSPNILAGKDLKAGGTWLGVNEYGKFAALTNYRDPAKFNPNAISRGRLVSKYLKSERSVSNFIDQYIGNTSVYNGFSLLLYDNNDLYYFSSIDEKLIRLEPGIYGLSNALINSNWPKVKKGRGAMKTYIENKKLSAEEGFDILFDKTIAKDKDLPSTGVDIEKERLLSPMHIAYPGYGTRSSNVVFFNEDDTIQFFEKDHLTGQHVEKKFTAE